jgi:aspartate/methionine/tyrosine aminotransferase
MEFSRKATVLEAEGHHIIRLGVGEPDFGPPIKFVDAFREVLESPVRAYTNALGLEALREKISGFYDRMHGVKVPTNRIAVTSGASAALLMTCAALVDEGDEVLIGDPSYPCNREFMQSMGAKVKLIPTTPETNFQLSLEMVKANWGENTKGILIATPSNPTGTSVEFSELKAICDFVKAKGGFRIIDEIYLNLADRDENENPAKTILEYDEGAIVINSFSKFFGMTGYRLGWCVVPDKLIGYIEKIAQNYYICASTPVQVAALECFSDEAIKECEGRREILLKRREYVLQRLDQIGLDVPVKPNGAFYVYIDVSATGMTGMEFCEAALINAHVSLTPGDDFGISDTQKYVRLSYASSMQELEEGLKRLEKWLNK